MPPVLGANIGKNIEARRVAGAHLAFNLFAESKDFAGLAKEIMEARDAYVDLSMETKAQFTDKIVSKIDTPIVGIYYSEFVAGFDRIVRHSKTTALAESQPQFWVKRKKLERIANEAPDVKLPEKVDPDDFLERFHEENYL